MNNRMVGSSGEVDVISKIPCPNCGKRLMQLPTNYPLYDVQCSGCSFRAQVKTNLTKPKSEIFGAGWDVMEKVLKCGFLVPPLIVNFEWASRGVKYQEIRFFPFVPKAHLKKRQLSATARRANYKMFNYVGLNALPSFTLYKR